MSVRTEVYGTIYGPRIGLSLKDRRTELTRHGAEELMAELAERIEQCAREERANAKARIQRMHEAYENRKAAQSG